MSETKPGFTLPTRKQIRLRDYDYTLPGVYFITICCAQRACLFGSIRNGELTPTPLGRLVQAELAALPTHYPGYLQLDASVVMPNHLHAILFFVRPLTKDEMSRQPPLLSNIVRLLKAGVSFKWKADNGEAKRIWHPRYHDHIVRHEKALERVREYVVNNPRQWELDRENRTRSGEHEFYRWMEAYSRKTAITQMKPE